MGQWELSQRVIESPAHFPAMQATVSEYKTEPDSLVDDQLAFILESSILFAKAIGRTVVGFTFHDLKCRIKIF